MNHFWFLLFVCSFLVFPNISFAHQIKTDHGTTVMLHVDPSDEPYSGTTTRMYLVFTGGENNTNPEECNCIAYIAPYSKIENIKEEGTKYDFSQSERVMGSYSISHIFARHDIYAVVLEGTPKEGATFEPFRIEYSLRVARGEEILLPDTKLPTGNVDYIYLLGGIIAFFLVCGFFAWKWLSRRRHPM